MKKAEIQNSVVVNIILVDPENVPEWCADWPDATDDAFIGGTYDGGVFTPPTPQPPTPEQLEEMRAGMSLSFAQLLIGLVGEGWITDAEGRDWRDRVALPAAVSALIASLPADQQFAAETRAFAPSEVLRLDPLVVSLGAAQGKTPDELDQFFITYSQV